MSARNGDHLFTLFECEYCAFYRLKRTTPKPTVDDDKLLLEFIRRANLDAFWVRRPSTIANLLGSFKEYRDTCQLLGFNAFNDRARLKASADYGMRTALVMLWKSLKPGKHEETIKYSTLRGFRKMTTDVEQTLDDGKGSKMVMRDKGFYRDIQCHPTDSTWFRHFNLGLKTRIGERTKQDLAMSPEVVKGVLGLFDEEWRAAVNDGGWVRARLAAEGACFFALTYAAGLRSFEVPMIVLTSLINQFEPAQGNTPACVGIPMCGRFKSRGPGKWNVIVFTVQTTGSGVELGLWLRRLILALRRVGISAGWLFQDEEGRAKPSSTFTEPFYTKLETLFERSPELFPPSVDIREDYGPLRSGRRGANTQALKEFKLQTEVDWFFRWNTDGVETSSLPMHVLYAERKVLKGRFLRVAMAF